MSRSTRYFAIGAIAVAGLGVGALSGVAHATTVSASATTTLHARPDSGFGGNTWSNDAMTRVSTATLVGADSTLTDCGATATTCYTFTGTISDTGTAYAVTGATSPGAQGVAIKGSPTAAITGGTSVSFHASSDVLDPTLVPTSVTGGLGVSTTDWVEQFFPSGTTFGAGPTLPNWSWTYNDAKDCQSWTDAYNVTQADSGDITGVDSCTTSVAAIPNQTATVGDLFTYQVKASTTSSDTTLNYTATGLPAGLTINSATGLISGTPSAGATGGNATVTVTDFGGKAASATTTFSVSQPPPPPTTVVLSHGGVKPGTLQNNRAVVVWQATPAAPGGYRVVINGPNFNFRVGYTTITAASYEGLAAGHTYTVYVTPLDAHGNPDGATGHITFVTTR